MAGLGYEVFRVTGIVRHSSVNSLGSKFPKPGSLSLQKIGNDVFNLVLVTNIPHRMKKFKLQKQRFKLNHREQHLTVSMDTGGVNICIRDVVPAQLQTFIAYLEEIRRNGMLGQINSSPRSGTEDIENRPVNNKQKGPILKTQTPVKASGSKSTLSGGLAAVLAKPSTPSTYTRRVALVSTNKSNKKSPLHDRTQDSNTYCDSGGQHAASSFYGTNNSWSPVQSHRAVKSSPTLRPKFLSKHTISFRDRAKPVFEEEVALTGFSNLGNTCYMNSILQSLLGLASFAQDVNNEALLKKVSCKSLYKNLHSLLSCKSASAHPDEIKMHLRKVKTAISEAATRFSGHMQHDAQEFLCQVLDQLKVDVSVVNHSPKSDNPIGHRTQAEESSCPVTSNFECRVVHKISCKQCKASVSKEEVLHDLSLQINLSSHIASISIDKLIEAYFEDEEIEFSCETCSNTKAIVTHRFSKLPRVLILHLQRSGYDRQTEQQAKKKDKITLAKYINIDELCAVQVKPPIRFDMKHDGILSSSGKTPPKKKQSQENEENQNVLTPPTRRKLYKYFTGSVKKRKKRPDNNTVIMSSNSVADCSPKRQGKQTTSGTISTDVDSNDVTKLCSLPEEQQLKHVMELSAKEAKQSHVQNTQGDGMFASRNQFGDDDEWTLNGGSGADSDEEVVSVIESKTNCVERAAEVVRSPEKCGSSQSPRKVCSNNAEQQETCAKEDGIYVDSDTTTDDCVKQQGTLSSEGMGGSVCAPSHINKDCVTVDCTVISDCDEKLHSEGQSGACKRARDQTNIESSSSHCDSDNGSDYDYSSNLKRRKIIYTYSLKKARDPSLCSLMDQKPTLTKPDGNMLDMTARKGLIQPPPDDATIDLTATSTKDDLQMSEFNEDEIAKAIALSLQDGQNDEDVLHKALEMSMQEYEKGYSVDQEEFISPLSAVEDDYEDSGFQGDLEQQQHIYRLVSVVSHLGPFSKSGHYISDVFDCKARQWTSYDDSTARKIHEHAVRFGRAATVYIAFYLHKQCVDAIDIAHEQKIKPQEG